MAALLSSELSRNRSGDLSTFAGKTMQFTNLMLDQPSQKGNFDLYFGDIAIVSTDGTVTPIYSRQVGMGNTMVYNWNNAVTQLNAFDENAPGSGPYPSNTLYYLGDHLGSTRMVTSGGGWPVTSDTFHPFGLEPYGTSSTNHYQYASLERDGESGLDHATFRQLASSQGRWLSPDPYDGSYDAGNPQSFNRYAYVLNNPVAFNDPSGLRRPPSSTDDDGGGGLVNVHASGSGSQGFGASWNEFYGSVHGRDHDRHLRRRRMDLQ